MHVMPRNITCICPGTLQANFTSLAYLIAKLQLGKAQTSLHIHTVSPEPSLLLGKKIKDGTEKWTSCPTGNPISVIEGHGMGTI